MPLNADLRTHDGIWVRDLLDPNGGVFDGAGGFDRLLPPHDDPSSLYWRFIDPTGTTMFNHLQMPGFIDELDQLATLAKPGIEQRGLARLRTLAITCQTGHHLYLWFHGD